MKLLYIEPIRLPTEKAHGIQIMEMCAAFARQGVEVELIVSDRKTPIADDPFKYYNVEENFKITRLPAPDLIAFGPVGFWLFLVLFSRKALRYASAAKADFVYTRTRVVASLLSKRYHKPIVWEVHARYAVTRSMLRSLRLFVTITEGLAKWYESRGVPDERIVIAPDGVNLTGFERLDKEAARERLRQRLDLPHTASIALYLGSFGVYSWKGVDVARDAARYAKEATWLFVGGSPEECVALLRDAAQNIRTLPRAGRTEVPQLLAGADALILPNKKGDIVSEEDTSPLKLFEYMASGVPIVASDLPSIVEVLDESTAYLVQPNDPRALAHGVQQVLKDGQAVEKGKIARAKVDAYTWDKRANTILTTLRERI